MQICGQSSTRSRCELQLFSSSRGDASRTAAATAAASVPLGTLVLKARNRAVDTDARCAFVWFRFLALAFV